MNEEQTSFKITDRRLFNPDGTPREAALDEVPEPSPAPTVPEPPAATAASPTVSADAARPEAGGSRAEARRAAAGAEELPDDIPGADDPGSFVNFAMTIASNAASSLGMMENPVTRKREVDLELAKHWIDILGMLEQKTRGNLIAEEEQILEGLLADLRLQYVSLAGATTPQTPQGYSGRDITGGR